MPVRFAALYAALMITDTRLVAAAIICLLAGSASGCSGAGAPEPEADFGVAAEPIFGGDAAAPSQIYSTVAIVAPGDPTYLCSGVLIAPSVVVTAAHCIYKSVPNDLAASCLTEYAPSELLVVAGALNATTATADQKYDVKNTFPSPGFICPLASSVDPNSPANDLAIVLLAQSISSLSVIQTYAFDPTTNDLPQGTLMTINGYGSTGGTNPIFGMLNIAQTPYQQQASPQSKMELIAGATGSPDTCGGDSGGPVYVTVGGTMYVVGITSRENGKSVACGPSSMGTIYTILSAYDDWLKTSSGGTYVGAIAADGGIGDVGSGTALPGCICRVDGAPASSGPGLWMGLGIVLLATRRRRR